MSQVNVTVDSKPTGSDPSPPPPSVPKISQPTWLGGVSPNMPPKASPTTLPPTSSSPASAAPSAISTATVFDTLPMESSLSLDELDRDYIAVIKKKGEILEPEQWQVQPFMSIDNVPMVEVHSRSWGKDLPDGIAFISTMVCAGVLIQGTLSRRAC